MKTRTLIGDMPVGGWVDRFVPAPARPYVRLMRLDRPIGAWILLFPGWWSLALAADGLPDLLLMGLFFVGAFVMRGAGCTINDILDRDYDSQVERTRGRPIPSGAISLTQALAFLLLELAVGLAILLPMNRAAVAVGAASLLLVFPYPMMKRITYWPQAWLGLTFNWGALLGWVAATGHIGLPALLLYAGGLFWTLGYDTIYAHQDKEDDMRIGVKSTALALGKRTQPFLFVFYGLFMLLAAAAAWNAGIGFAFWPLWVIAGAQLTWQAATVRLDDGGDCLAKFRSNTLFGWLLLAAIVAGRITR